MTGKSLRGLIHDEVCRDGQIAGMLAKYAGGPAFFYSKAPQDKSPGWEGYKYPRVSFGIDTRQDPERKTAGTMSMNIFVTTECPEVGGSDPDRAIEERLIELLSGAFFTDAEGNTYCLVWERSDSFVMENISAETHPEVYGLTSTFEIMEFPPQFTTDPDPVQGLNRWTRANFPEAALIGYDNLPPVFRPDNEHPAIYWRFDGDETTDRQSYAVTWYNGTFCAHVICESVMERNRWIKVMVERAQMAGEVILPDTSPMFLKRIVIRHAADPLREGQIQIIGQYGVLEQQRKERAQFKLMHPYINKEKEGYTWRK